MRLRTRIVVGVICVAALMACASPATASHVQCGDVITQDTALDSDVVCAGGEHPVAFIIGADNVTLDLGGYRVEGHDPVEDDTIGVSGGGVPRRGVTIENGTVTGFSRAIWFPPTEGQDGLTGGVVRTVTADGLESVHVSGNRNLVSGSRLTGSQVPLAVYGHDNTVAQNDIESAGAPRALLADRNVHVMGNQVSLPGPILSGPGASFPAAIYVFRHRDALVRGNVVTAAGYGIYVTQADGDGRSVVDKNVAADSTWTGIYADSSLIRRNVVRGNQYGIEVAGNSDAFDNTATGNRTAGIRAATGGRVERNVASGNDEFGIIAGFTAHLRGNVANHNGGDGIGAFGEPQGDDGYPEQFVTVTRNTANFNGGYGIRGVRAIDGGGNRAHGNALGDCLNVGCK
jgi:hypothetical protein